MDLKDFQSTSSIQMESMRATMNALRSQLNHEKDMLKKDIVQTLKCQSILGSGSADLLYTSGLLARLKSLEDNREPPREQDMLREPLHPDHAGTTSEYSLEGRTEDDARKFGGAGEVYRMVYSNEGSSNCVRHCCSLKSAQALKSPSGVQVSAFSNKIPASSVSMRSPSLPRVDEVPGACEIKKKQPIISWSGDDDVRPSSKGYSFPKPEYPFAEPQPSYSPAYYRPAEYAQYPYTPSCTCIPFRAPSFTKRAQDILTDPCNRHCLSCCTWQLPEKQPAVVQKEKCLCRKSSHCRHYNPEGSPRHYSHHHEKAPRYNRHHQTTKEVERDTAKSAGDDSTLVADIDESQDAEDEIEYAIIEPVETEIGDDELIQVEDIDRLPSSKIHVTPRSSSAGSDQSEKTEETLVQEPNRDTAVQYHYPNELSSEISGGSSLFESETTLDREVVHQPACAQRRIKVHSKPRRRGKKTTREQGITKSGGVNLSSSTERTRSTAHPPRLADYDPTVRSTCVTATPDLSRGRPKDPSNRNSSNKSRWSGTELLLRPPAMHHTIPSPNPRKKPLKNDPLKPVETYYASLAGLPKSKRSQRGDTDNRSERIRDVKTPVLSRKTSRTTRPPNPFNLIFDELRTSPILRSMAVPTGRKIF